MFLKGEGGVKASVRQAGRWFQLAAEKGHAGAQATLGNLLFQSGKVVRGLAMMTAALERASPADQPWIRGMQEEAFSLAGEADRRTAIALGAGHSRQGRQPVTHHFACAMRCRFNRLCQIPISARPDGAVPEQWRWHPFES